MGLKRGQQVAHPTLAAERVGKSGSDRINAMAAANVIMQGNNIRQNWNNTVQVKDENGNMVDKQVGIYQDGKDAITGLGKAAGQMMNGDYSGAAESAGGVSVSISYGQQKSVQEQMNAQSKAAASGVYGQDVKVIARDKTLNVVGSDISGSLNTTLYGKDGINIEAFRETNTERSSNKSSGFNAGVAVAFGDGISLGFTGGANYGKGHGNGDGVTHRNSHIGSSTGKTTLLTDETVKITGGQVQGKGVAIDAKNLEIASLQDTYTYQGKQMDMNAQVTVGYGADVKANLSKSKVNADYASVNEQSGIFAGDDGYQINIKDKTNLKAGLITSTQNAENNGKNSFATGTLTFEDLANKSEYKAEAFSAGTGGMGMGKDSDSQYSITKAGINTANIVITDENKQKEITGKTAEETKNAVKTDLTVENYQANLGSLKNNFDKEKVLKELETQVTVTKDFTTNAKAVVKDYIEPMQAELRKERDELETKQRQTTSKEEWDAVGKEIEKVEDEIYKYQYARRMLEMAVGAVALDPTIAVGQGSLQIIATAQRRATLRNSRLFNGIEDEQGNYLSNASYGSGSFDGKKLGGVRISTRIICGDSMERCQNEKPNGVMLFNSDEQFKTLDDVTRIETNPNAKPLHGATGGFQPIKGTMFGIEYDNSTWWGRLFDRGTESWAGSHDLWGGQIPGYYDKQGNTNDKNRTPAEQKKVDRYSERAVVYTAPFGLAELIPNDLMQIIWNLK